MYYWEAIQKALRQEMDRDPRVILLGEDIGTYGGAFKVTRGMLADYGADRVIDTPISEAAITGICNGAAITGLRPVMEVMFMDFTTLCLDQLLNHAGKFRYMWGGKVNVPFVLRTPMGAGRGYGPTHSQSLESLLIKCPGIKVVAPATPSDAFGLLVSAIRDPNPVVFLEHKRLYGVKGNVQDSPETIPIGKAAVLREGSDVTLMSYSYMVRECLAAAEILGGQGVSACVLDLRSLAPMDDEAILNASAASGRVIFVEEGTRTGGVGAEVVSRVFESRFFDMQCPPVRIALPDVPIPCSPPLERALLPNAQAIVQAALKSVNS
ncbi:MAG: alpha-ketoacid dehydrogenase subunit beta [Candidatus Brocadiia bacterium]